MYAIYEADMIKSRKVDAFGEFETIESAIEMLEALKSRIEFWERDADHDAADVLMSNGRIFAIEVVREA